MCSTLQECTYHTYVSILRSNYLYLSLEDIMPEEEIPEGENVVQCIEEIKPISLEVKDMVMALMDHTAAACHHAGLSAECLSTLANI